MSASRWQTTDRIFVEALEAPDTARAAHVAQACGDDEELQRDVLSLLAAAEGSADFLEMPALKRLAAAIAADAWSLRPGQRVGAYVVRELLGAGGVGEVWRATDERLNRDVSIKVLLPHLSNDPERVRHFTEEARTAGSLNHPNILSVHDVGEHGSAPFIVSEYVEGESLRTRLKRGPLSVELAIAVAVQMARGLSAAHQGGIIHCDLKPDNIFLRSDGGVKILDFGLAKLNVAPSSPSVQRDAASDATVARIAGTAGYTAPEQIRGEEADVRSDLFALGVTMYEMLAGDRPFNGNSAVDTLRATLSLDPSDLRLARKGVPPSLALIVMRLLKKSPDARFQSADELLHALERVRARTARSAVWAGVTLTTLAIVLAVAGWFYPRDAARTPTATATIAIFPFHSVPDSADGQLLERGLADVFISRLNQVLDIHVLPLSATERLRNANPREAARSLGADYVLTGTLQRVRNRVRASVQLLAISEDRATWTNTFDVDATSAFSIQDAVVAQVLQEIAPHLSSSARARLVEPGTRNSEAYEHYLRGRAHAAQVTGVDFVRATGSFRRAVTLDPDYADAWAALGAAYRRLPLVGEVEPKGAFTEAERAATRALDLAPDHPEALSVLGTVAFWYEWDYPRAEELLRRAATGQPSSAESHVYLAHLLSNLGRHDEALVEIGRARSLDPNLPIARSLEGQFLFMARRYDEALARLDAAVDLAPRFIPGHVMRAYPLLALRRYDEAIHECEVARELEARIPDYGSRVFPSALRGYALAKLGRRAEAEATLERIRKQEREVWVQPASIALVLHGLGRDDEAIRELNRAVDLRDAALTFLGVDPKWDELRTSPLFQGVLSRVNLLEVSNRLLANGARSGGR